jgi:ketosteroid isomerase-like protein
VSQENVEIVRRVFDAWSRGDLVGALEMAPDDLVVDLSHSLGPAKGIYRGKDEALKLHLSLRGLRRFAVGPGGDHRRG